MILLDKYEEIYKEFLRRDKYLESLINRIKEVTIKYSKSSSYLINNYNKDKDLREELIFYLLNKTLPAILQYSTEYNILIQDVFWVGYNTIIDIVYSKNLSEYSNIHTLVVRKVCKEIEDEFSLKTNEDIEFVKLQEAEIFFNKYQYFDETEEKVFSKLEKENVQKVLGTLKGREAEILRYRFGFYCEPMTLEEVGKLFNVSRGRIRQIEAKALRKLRHPDRIRIFNYFYDLYEPKRNNNRKELEFSKRPDWKNNLKSANEKIVTNYSIPFGALNFDGDAKIFSSASDFDSDELKNPLSILLKENTKFASIYNQWNTNKIDAFKSLLQNIQFSDKAANSLLVQTLINSNLMCQYFPKIFSKEDFVAILDLAIEESFEYCITIRELFELSKEYFSLIYKREFERLDKFSKYFYFVKHFLLVFNSVRFKMVSVRQIKEGYRYEIESYKRFNYDKFIEIYNKYCNICKLSLRTIDEFNHLYLPINISFMLFNNEIKSYNDLMEFSNMNFKSIKGIDSHQAFKLYQFLNSINIM